MYTGYHATTLPTRSGSSLVLESRRGRVWLLLLELHAPSLEMTFSGCFWVAGLLVEWIPAKME